MLLSSLIYSLHEVWALKIESSPVSITDMLRDAVDKISSAPDRRLWFPHQKNEFVHKDLNLLQLFMDGLEDEEMETTQPDYDHLGSKIHVKYIVKDNVLYTDADEFNGYIDNHYPFGS